MYDPRVKQSRREKLRVETYATYLRDTPSDKLTTLERAQLQEELDWCEANPELKAELDSLIDRYVRLGRTRTAMDGRTIYPAGSELLVVDRWADWLHVIYENRTVLVVKPSWVELEARRI